MVERLVGGFPQPDSADAAIWLGRRTAYLGRYREAIEIEIQAEVPGAAVWVAGNHDPASPCPRFGGSHVAALRLGEVTLRHAAAAGPTRAPSIVRCHGSSDPSAPDSSGR